MQALQADDECRDGEEPCAINALQARVKSMQQGGQVENRTDAELNGFCSGKSEGQHCNSNHGYVYCSIGRNDMPWLNRECANVAGSMSKCKEDGVGLTTGQCDDPFCRNGGAYAG